MKRKIFLTIVLPFCFTMGCATTMKDAIKIDPDNPEKTMAEAYSKVNLEDGINRDEAKSLANTYFLVYISGCGGAFEAVDQGDEWEVKTVFGYAAVPYNSIFVEKNSGKIICSKGPVIMAPENID